MNALFWCEAMLKRYVSDDLQRFTIKQCIEIWKFTLKMVRSLPTRFEKPAFSFHCYNFFKRAIRMKTATWFNILNLLNSLKFTKLSIAGWDDAWRLNSKFSDHNCVSDRNGNNAKFKMKVGFGIFVRDLVHLIHSNK